MITEESFVDFKCPHCNEPVSFPQESAGFVQACPNCTESFIVPEDGSEVGKQIPLPIKTPRLILRRLAAHDWKDLLELMSDEEFFRYRDGVPLEEESVLHWLESDVHVKLTTPEQALYLGIEVQNGGKLIGYLSLDIHRPATTPGHVQHWPQPELSPAGIRPGSGGGPARLLLRGTKAAPGRRLVRQPECRGVPAPGEGGPATRGRICEEPMGARGVDELDLVRRVGRRVSGGRGRCAAAQLTEETKSGLRIGNQGLAGKAKGAE